ncbi:hypothetical protein ACQCSX_22555 (plasmid) [Pseudarthrobacter sp. P1]|uniref:hypothetical protein n=1 Tax=Pseudarthrobacter sp. P1 TaxID=3418418 RepID=UPI003CF43598
MPGTAPVQSAAPSPLPALTTPCHGEPLSIGTRFESSSYYGTDVVDGITCPATG